MKFKGAIFISLLALLALLLPFQFCPQAYAQTSDVECWAVIVGVADYQHLDDLNYTDDDAQGLYDELAPIYGEDHIMLLVNNKANKAYIEDTILDWLVPMEDSDDIVLIFFSGHGGLNEDDGHGYLCPYDSPNDISDDELVGWLDGLDSDNIVVILDSYYSGGFIDEVKGDGRVIMTACTEDEDSWEFDALGHGVFSYYILDGFDHLDDVDTDDDNKVSAEEFFYYAEPKVIAYAPEPQYLQHPQIDDGYPTEGSHDGELILFEISPSGSSNVWIGGVVGGTALALVVTILMWRGTRKKRVKLPPSEPPSEGDAS